MTAQTQALSAASRDADIQHRQAFGYWLYILSDLILFYALFATFAVQMRSFVDGPTGQMVLG